MIDDNWGPDYGSWFFESARFPDPAAMVDQLHEWGCSVMVWVVPFISPDSATFRHLEARELLLRDHSGAIAVRRWWNGLSALLDLSNPETIDWITQQCDDLIATTGIDGFKFDGGDIGYYRADDLTARPAQPVDQCEAWARVGLRYSFNEYRACWRMGGQPLGQRLQDKPPHWGPSGIESLIPEMLTQGLIGHPYSCPDMVGGGEILAMARTNSVDQEFFVRYAQLAALAPMIQFSVDPARVLDEEHLNAVRTALSLRQRMLPRILDLVEAAAWSGEPIVRPMAYHADGCDDVIDQFFLGPDVLVAPVLRQGATKRSVAIPEGTWRADNGQVVQGPTRITINCDLASLPWFELIAP